MGGAINSVEMLLLDHLSGKTSYTVPTWYLGVSTTLPTETGSNFTEPSNGGYIRPTLTAATWTAATGGDPSSTSYGGGIVMAAATGGWGTLAYWGLYSVKTQGTGIVQIWGTINTQKAIQTNDVATWATNSLKIELGDPPDTY